MAFAFTITSGFGIIFAVILIFRDAVKMEDTRKALLYAYSLPNLVLLFLLCALFVLGLNHL